jgi:hypothetical protein
MTLPLGRKMARRKFIPPQMSETKCRAASSFITPPRFPRPPSATSTPSWRCAMPIAERAGALTPTGPLFIAVSFDRLFLGGLLPSRARFRFAGSLPIPLHPKLAQSRAQPTCLQFRCLTDGVQSKPFCIKLMAAAVQQGTDSHL